MKHIVFSIVPVRPFGLDLHGLGLSRRRPANTIDCWDGETFKWALMIDGQIVEVAVQQDGPPERARLQVNLAGARLTEHTQILTKSCWNECWGYVGIWCPSTNWRSVIRGWRC